MGAYPISDGNAIYPNFPLNHQVFLAQFEAIKTIAKKGPCVIVGRCADYVLKENTKVINVFINADFDFRTKRISEKENISLKKAEELIKKVDKKRAAHYKYYAEKKWGLASNYDICVNSSNLGIEKTADLITCFIDKISSNTKE